MFIIMMRALEMVVKSYPQMVRFEQNLCLIEILESKTGITNKLKVAQLYE